jgi:hypothetical protein
MNKLKINLSRFSLVFRNRVDSLKEFFILRDQKKYIKIASLTLAKRFPELLGVDMPYILHGIHSWQLDILSVKIPPIDVAFPSDGFFFSFLPDSRDISESSWRLYEKSSNKSSETKKILLDEGSIPPTFSKRKLLEQVFRKRLRYSGDVIPILPIFLDPRLIITIKDDDQFKAYIDSSWNTSILWGLSQLPDNTEGLPGSWSDRRRYLEDAKSSSLFNI